MIMKFNLKNIWLLLFVIIIGTLSYALGKCGVTRSCEAYENLNNFSFSVFEPTFLFMLAVLPLSIIVLFCSNAFMRRWLRLAAWWIPLSAILVAVAPRNSNSWMPLYPEPTKENVALLMGALLTAISVALIVRSNRTYRTPKKG